MAYNLLSFEEKVNTITNDKIKILAFTKVKEPATFECLRCHKIQKVARAESLLKKGKKYQCQFCHHPKDGITQKTFHKIKNLCEKNNKEVISFTKVGNNATFRCLKCDNLFSREPLRFLKNSKCPICESRCIALPIEQCEKELKALGYELVDKAQYKNLHQKVLIRHDCGFIWKVLPSSILSERSNCPKCSKRRSKGERIIAKYLEENNVFFIPEWSRMIEKHLLFFDFYIPKNNLLIEFQGMQHYVPVDYFGGEKSFEIRKKYDNYKKKWAIENNYKLLEISYLDIENIEKILKAQRLSSE